VRGIVIASLRNEPLKLPGISEVGYRYVKLIGL